MYKPDSTPKRPHNETRPAEHIPSWLEQNIDPLYERGKSVIKKSQIDPGQFTLYGKGVQAEAAKYVQSREENFIENDAKKLGTILEAILVEQIAKSHWFGEEATPRSTTPYDDYKNGIDILINYKPKTAGERAKVLGLGIDATFSISDAQRKIDEIFKRLRLGTLGEIQYYQDENFQGRMSDVPLVVLSMHKDNLERVARLWSADRSEELASHSIQYMLLAQARDQLSTMIQFARILPKKHPEVTTERAQALENAMLGPGQLINKRLQERQKELGKITIPNDFIMHEMQKHMATWRERIQQYT